MAATVSGAALLAGMAIPAAAGTLPTAGPGAVTQFVLAAGHYKLCLNDFKQAGSAGSPVTLWACGGPADKWVLYSDGTIRPSLHQSDALDVSNGKAVLDAVPAAGPTPNEVWAPRADGAVINSGLSTPSGAQYYLNDPGGNTAEGTQVIAYQDSKLAAANEHWLVQGAHYATTVASNLPDAGLSGGYWALDNYPAKFMVVYTGDNANGHTYDGSQVAVGSWTSFPGAPTPTDSSTTIGDVLTGGVGGWYTYPFTTNAWVTTAPPATASGLSGWGAIGTDHFFGAGAVTGHGPKDGIWAYVSDPDNCGAREFMVQTDTSGAWNNSTGWTSMGNITAPAAGQCLA